MARDLFKEYRRTTKQERVAVRRELGSISKTERFLKWTRWAYMQQKKRCFYCDNRIYIDNRKSYHIEHRIPVYWGGKNDYENLVLACPPCNMTKGTDQLIRNKKEFRKANEKRIARGLKPKIYL